MGMGVDRSPADVTARLDRLIADIRSRFHKKLMQSSKDESACGDVLIVAHGHILRAFAMRWVGRELTEGVSLLLEGIFIPLYFVLEVERRLMMIFVQLAEWEH